MDFVNNCLVRSGFQNISESEIQRYLKKSRIKEPLLRFIFKNLQGTPSFMKKLAKNWSFSGRLLEFFKIIENRCYILEPDIWNCLEPWIWTIRTSQITIGLCSSVSNSQPTLVWTHSHTASKQTWKLTTHKLTDTILRARVITNWVQNPTQMD